MTIHIFRAVLVGVYITLSQAYASFISTDHLIKPASYTDGIMRQMQQQKQGIGFGPGQLNNWSQPSKASTPVGTLQYVLTTNNDIVVFVKDKNTNALSVLSKDLIENKKNQGWDVLEKSPDGKFTSNETQVAYGIDSFNKISVNSNQSGYTGTFPVVTSVTR